MKNKLRFIMPRLIGPTAVAGIAALVITTLFKLLLGLTLLAGDHSLIFLGSLHLKKMPPIPVAFLICIFFSD